MEDKMKSFDPAAAPTAELWVYGPTADGAVVLCTRASHRSPWRAVHLSRKAAREVAEMLLRDADAAEANGWW